MSEQPDLNAPFSPFPCPMCGDYMQMFGKRWKCVYCGHVAIFASRVFIAGKRNTRIAMPGEQSIITGDCDDDEDYSNNDDEPDLICKGCGKLCYAHELDKNHIDYCINCAQLIEKRGAVPP